MIIEAYPWIKQNNFVLAHPIIQCLMTSNVDSQTNPFSNPGLIEIFSIKLTILTNQNSQTAKSLLTNDVFSIINIYLSILEKTETQSTSPVQTSRHTNVRNKIAAFSEFLETIRENLSNNELSQIVNHDLQEILVWFIIIVYFTHTIDLISQAKKNFILQSTHDDKCFTNDDTNDDATLSINAVTKPCQLTFVSTNTNAK